MDDKPKLNKHGFPQPEVLQMAQRDTTTHYSPTPYTPAQGEEPMTPMQRVSASGKFPILAWDWDEEGNPITEVAKSHVTAVDGTDG